MSKTEALPTNLLQAIRYFADADVATEFVAELRWPKGPVCPRCGCMDHSYLTTRRVWKCKGCKKQYSVKLGTIFEDSPLGLDKWLPAVWLVANSKNGISSHELARSLGVTQKSAWFMLHRIRLAMQAGSFNKLGGTVEVDESYIGGKGRNMHPHKRKNLGTGRGSANKTVVVGVKQRDGETRAQVVGNIKRDTLHGLVHQHVEEGASLFTDAFPVYKGLGRDYDHRVVDHAEAYVDGQVHTNGLENFWSLLKRGLHGTYVSVEPFHLFRYLDERLFTYNERDLSDLGRFSLLLQRAAGRRLTYAELTAKS